MKNFLKISKNWNVICLIKNKKVFEELKIQEYEMRDFIYNKCG
jgi:hypothetical protein